MRKILSLMTLLACFASFNANAIIIGEYTAFLFSPTLGAQSLKHSEIGFLGPVNDFSGTGVDVSFNDGLDADGFGSVSWEFVNNTGSVLEDARLFVFLDAEIDEATNTFFNEYGELVDVSGTGANDNAADSWQIGEPFLGDIFFNAENGFLTDTNGVPQGFEDDVSLALGFELGDLFVGDILTGLFETSLSNIGGLSHTDPDSALTFFFNGIAEIERIVVDVPEAGSFGLLCFASVIALSFTRRRFNA